MKIWRRFSIGLNKLPFPEALQYSLDWKFSELNNGIKLSVIENQDFVSQINILSAIGKQHKLDTRQIAEKIKEKFDFQGFDFVCDQDKTIFNIISPKNEIENIIQNFISLTKNPKDFWVNSNRITETDLQDIVINSCLIKSTNSTQNNFPSPSIEDLFFSNNLTISSYNPPENLNLLLESLSAGPKSSNFTFEYVPKLQIFENSSEIVETCVIYQAPPFSSPDFYLYKFLEKFMHTPQISYINPKEQFNYLYTLFASIPGIYSHNVFYEPFRSSGVFFHLVKSHPLAVPFAGAAIMKSMNRLGKEIKPKELQRGKNAVFSDILGINSMQSKVSQRNLEVFWGKKERDYAESVLNLSEEYVCETFKKWSLLKFPSVGVKGKIMTDNSIGGMFDGYELQEN